jgi:16S rRNA (uracil1498-N3)-methyltransferase
MRISRIFSEQKLALDAEICLNEDASRYVAKVLRMTLGREMVLFNGEGGEFRADIIAIDKKQVRVRILEKIEENRESPLDVRLCIGLSRGERMDWVIQKACELGATSIQPLFTERTEVKLNPQRLEKKMQHWQQVIVSACEQCQRNILPTIHTPQNIAAFLPDCDAQLKLVLHHRSDIGLSKEQAPASVALLIGPEGGLSEVEIQAAMDQGFKALTLGPRVLRTETAPLAALSLCQYLWGDLA